MLLQVLEKHSVKFLKMAGQYDVPLLMLKADVTNFLLSRVTKDTVLSMHSGNFHKWLGDPNVLKIPKKKNHF